MVLLLVGGVALVLAVVGCILMIRKSEVTSSDNTHAR